ncbi:MAG: DNA polymerase IV [Bacteroidota bacterium]
MEPVPHIRKIIHIDMDAYYASVEQKDNPELKGKPIAVGGSKERGVVAAASYEARKFGVRSAMPSVTAAKRCPDLIFVKPRFSRYAEISKQIRNIFFEYTDLVEPLSLDEAYLDVTENQKGIKSATMIATEIRKRILETTGLTSSAGISYNKFLAKTASDINKPNGQFVILPEEADSFLLKFPIHKFFGIGKVTAEKMKLAGIFTGADLRKKSLEDLIIRYGKSGSYYFNICRGIDNRSVEPDRERKSLSVENTYEHDLNDLDEVYQHLDQLAVELFRRYQKQGKMGKTLTIKIKYGDFQQITRSHTQETSISELNEIQEMSRALVEEDLLRPEGIRLLGIGISGFIQEDSLPSQLTLNF